MPRSGNSVDQETDEPVEEARKHAALGRHCYNTTAVTRIKDLGWYSTMFHRITVDDMVLV